MQRYWIGDFGTGQSNQFVLEENALLEFYDKVWASTHQNDPPGQPFHEFQVAKCVKPELYAPFRDGPAITDFHFFELPEGVHLAGKDKGCHCGRLQWFEASLHPLFQVGMDIDKVLA